MGKPYVYTQTQIIRNRKFFDWTYWNDPAGWNLVANGMQHIGPFGIGNKPNQGTGFVGGETYQCELEILVEDFQTDITFKWEGDTKVFRPPLGIRQHYTFPLNPVANFPMTFDVAATPGQAHKVTIYAVSVIGIMNGDSMYDMLYANSLCPAGKARTEFNNLGGGEEMYRIAGKQDASNCLIKVE